MNRINRIPFTCLWAAALALLWCLASPGPAHAWLIKRPQSKTPPLTVTEEKKKETPKTDVPKPETESAPEPASLVSGLVGSALLGLYIRRRRKAKAATEAAV